ncbi:hypothetical protein ACQP1U_14370 [Actinomycetota bacterium]
MNGVVVTVLGLLWLAACLGLGYRLEDRAMGAVRALVGERGWGGVILLLALHAATIALVAVPLVIWRDLRDSGVDPVLALLTHCAITTPLAAWWFQFLPSETTAFREVRADLEEVGLTRAQARVAAWTAGWLSVLAIAPAIVPLIASATRG